MIQTSEIEQDDGEIIDFARVFFNFHPHVYQEEFLKACIKQKRIAGKWSRQSGKSQSVSVYVMYKCLLEKTTIIIIAPTQNQASELYRKIRDLVSTNPAIEAMLVKDTATEMTLTNGSRIIALPCGPDGKTARGYTGDIVVIEEAGIMKDSIVNSVIIPMIASKKDKGQIIKIGTPLLKNHFYYSCTEDKKYTVINVGWQDCVKAGQYTQDFVDEQKEALSEFEFASEYEANFVADDDSFFKAKLINSCIEDYGLFQVF